MEIPGKLKRSFSRVLGVKGAAEQIGRKEQALSLPLRVLP